LVILSVLLAIGVGAAYIQVVSPDQLIQQGDNRTFAHARKRSGRIDGIITDRNAKQLAVSVSGSRRHMRPSPKKYAQVLGLVIKGTMAGHWLKC